MILICLHTSLLNIGHQKVQLRSSIPHDSIHLRAEVFQNLLSHATLCINCRCAHFTYGHVTLLTGLVGSSEYLFFCKYLELVRSKLQCCILMGETLTFYKIDKVRFIQNPVFSTYFCLDNKSRMLTSGILDQ